MDAHLIHALGLASAGITVAATGAALLVLSIVMSPRLAREIEDEIRSNQRT